MIYYIFEKRPFYDMASDYYYLYWSFNIGCFFHNQIFKPFVFSSSFSYQK